MTILTGGVLSNSINAQKVSAVKEGVGIEGVVVGKSTKTDVEKKIGKNYKWVTNKKYSYQMIYPNGVSFYFWPIGKTTAGFRHRNAFAV